MPVTAKIRDVMEQKITRVSENASISEVIKKMLSSEVWSVIVERQELPVGVVTERDIIRRAIAKGLDLDKAKAKEIMSSPLITIEPDATIGEAMELMTEKNVRRLYVVEKGKILGRITQTDLFENNLNIMLELSSLRSQI